MNGATAQRQGGRTLGEARPPIAAAHRRTDSWWALPVTVAVVLLAFIVYSTWAAFQNAHYYAAPYLSPFYSPCITKGCLHHTFGGGLPDITLPIIGLVLGTLANGSNVWYLPDAESYGMPGLYQEEASVLEKGSLEKLIEASAGSIRELLAQQ